ncbi:hypothetical protein PRUPE_I002500 [Prunus persica]|uniref:Uncharacterized protein n=1 Tax=Prunus persica TaxID=3760 RepID=M5XC78_PRUPE|nr:hypothetical protein PRUPE_I002500 [Prunus persica]
METPSGRKKGSAKEHSFFFGLALILQLDIEGIRTLFHTFFRLPTWVSLAPLCPDLMLFAMYMFVIAPNILRNRHLLSDPTGATVIRTYLTL